MKRTAFKWTILRPGGLSNNPGEGKVNVGVEHVWENDFSENLTFVCFAMNEPIITRETT